MLDESMSIKLTKTLIVFVVFISMIIFIDEFQQNIKKQSWLSIFRSRWAQFSVEAHRRSFYPMNYLIPNQGLFQTYKLLLQANKNLETSFECIGSPHNQSCLYKNLYYTNRTFWIFTTKKITYPLPNVRIGAWVLKELSPSRHRFYSYAALDEFIRHKVNPVVIPNLTLYFHQPWLSNIGHALFDGLYPAYVALIRFPPRHLQPFRIMLSTFNNYRNPFSEDVYNRFAGLGTINVSTIEDMSVGKWVVFEELVMGSGSLCQRCLQPNLQLPGGIELNGSRLFRDRMYQQHGLALPISRQNHSAERRDAQRPLKAYVIDNKRFTSQDRIEINAAIDEINRYTDTHLDQTVDNQTKLHWPLVYVSYISYPLITVRNDGFLQLNASEIEMKTSSNNSKMMGHLRLLQDMNIHISGPGTGQMYQTFLSDGSVNINLGGLSYIKQSITRENYTSFLEQYMTSGTPYIKGLYYPINERTKGIKKEILIKLIREAAQLILNGFSIPVNPKDNLAPDGQLFIEMCKLDKKFCRAVTDRWREENSWCIDTWPEDIVYENGVWSLQGIRTDDGKNLTCPYNQTLLHQLRQNYNINFRFKPH
jgi:hypothetical protein